LVFVQNNVKIAFVRFNNDFYIHPDYLAVEDLIDGSEDLTLAWARSLSNISGDLPGALALRNLEISFLKEYRDTLDMPLEELFGLLSAINLNSSLNEDTVH